MKSFHLTSRRVPRFATSSLNHPNFIRFACSAWKYRQTEPPTQLPLQTNRASQPMSRIRPFHTANPCHIHRPFFPVNMPHYPFQRTVPSFLIFNSPFRSSSHHPSPPTLVPMILSSDPYRHSSSFISIFSHIPSIPPTSPLYVTLAYLFFFFWVLPL